MDMVRTVRMTVAALAMLTGAMVATGASAGILDALKVMRNNRPPSTPFARMTPPPAPDYAQPASWAALPEMRDAADLTPHGIDAIDQTRAPADVFFIYPTVFFSRAAWNADISDTTYRQQVQDLPLASQASAFNACCAIYAPHYRQMTLGGFVRWSANSEAALDLAYRDVSRAFDAFLARTGNRPFIIAGHSQGSRLARRLIAERIDGTPLHRRMIAGYLIGHWMEQPWFDARTDVRLCTNAAQTGCVVTWSSFAEGRDGSGQRRTLARTSRYRPEGVRQPYACTNPIDWSAGTAMVPASDHAGGWLPAIDGDRHSSLTPQMVSARCADGALYVSPPPQDYLDRQIPFGNFHNVDINLFWMNIRRNAVERVASPGRQPR